MGQSRSLKKFERVKVCEQLYKNERQDNPMLRIVIEVSGYFIKGNKKSSHVLHSAWCKTEMYTITALFNIYRKYIMKQVLKGWNVVY